MEYRIGRKRLYYTECMEISTGYAILICGKDKKHSYRVPVAIRGKAFRAIQDRLRNCLTVHYLTMVVLNFQE